MQESRPVVQLLEYQEILAQYLQAVEYLHGYAELEAHRGLPAPLPDISPETELNESEIALVHPVFMLYVEREAALVAEAARIMGADVFVRPHSEVAQDIVVMQQEFPKLAFYQNIVCV